MRQNVFRFLKAFSTDPFQIDRLIVSAYIVKNKLEVGPNRFVRTYLISAKDEEEFSKLECFISLLTDEFDSLNLEHVIELFEFVISPADRIVNGAVYTPCQIREFITRQAFDVQSNRVRQLKIADLSCGCGGFLFNAVQLIRKTTLKPFAEIFSEQIFGLDIQQYAIDRTKIVLTLLAISEGEVIPQFKFNLFTGDALTFNWYRQIESFSGFEIILGNPPYVCSRKLSATTKRKLKKWEVSRTGHPDLYIPFFQIGIQLLKPNGSLGLITMNSFFKSLNGRALRQYLQNKQLRLKIIDFGTLQVFKKRATYTCICLFQNSTSETIQYRRLRDINELTSSDGTTNTISYSNLRAHSGWNLLHAELINKIESTGIPFSKRFKTRNGIATLKNQIFIFSPAKEDRDVYWLQNGSLYPIEKAICKEIVNPNLLTTQSNLSAISERFIFPYEFIEGKATIISENKLKNQFPLAYKYFLSKKKVLASRDKGKGKYASWFAFGRTQSLDRMKHKLFFPHIAVHSPNLIINNDENLFFYNGIAVIGENGRELLFLRKLMLSRLFWFYLKKTSKPYASGYISMSKNYIKDFGVYNFSEEDITYIIEEQNTNVLDSFIECRYGISLDRFME